MTRAPFQLLGVALSALMVSATPRAGFAKEPSSSSTTVDEAAPLIEEAIAARRRGQDQQALQLLEQAERLNPTSVRLQVHLAATHQALGDWEAADRYLAAALKDPSDPYIQRHEATLADARRTIDAHVASLELVGGPPGALIRLNGRSLGTLPLAETVRIAAGIYSLEATLAGHYKLTRSLALAGGDVTRESIQLLPISNDAPLQERSSAWGPSWVTWTFAGLAAGAGVVTGVAWSKREQHAEVWNDESRCVAPGRTREQMCGDELDAGKQAETVMWIAGGATLAFATASFVSLWFKGSDSKEAPQSAVACSLGWGQLACSGHF